MVDVEKLKHIVNSIRLTHYCLTYLAEELGRLSRYVEELIVEEDGKFKECGK